MINEERLRKKVLKGLKKPDQWDTTGITFDGTDSIFKYPMFHCYAIVIVDNQTNELRLVSEMPAENNIALLKYVDAMQKERKEGSE
jgi:hypothetical protein